MIKTLPKNTNGRDFVMGDLHGCFDQFRMFHDFIGFNPLTDRMFSVGDLVDRGPESLECLRLLNKPWFHAVKGNHEEMMSDFLLGGHSGDWWMPNGGNWWVDLTKDEKNEVIELVKQPLPLLITVTGEFHVIHAELSSDVEVTDEDMANEDKFREMALQVEGPDGAAVIWGRNLFTDMCFKAAIHEADLLWLKQSMFVKMFGPKLSQIFCGHTITQNPTRILGQTNLDTGAFLTGTRPWTGLTFAEPASGKFWKVSDDVNPVELTIVL